MARLGVSRFFERLGGASKGRPFPDPPHDEATIRDIFNLSRWFAGIGQAADETLANEASAEADARLRTAIDTLPVTLFEFDSNGIYTCVGGKNVGLFGVRPAQIVGRSVFEFPKLVPGKNLMVRRALGGEAVSFTGIWPLGRFMIRLQPRFDRLGRVTAVVGLGFPIGKLKPGDREMDQLLEALRQSEARFRAMCESAPLGIYVTNSNFELGYSNPALCEMLGRGPAELLGQNWRTALGVEGEEAPPSPRDPEALDGRVYERTMRLMRRDGSLVWTSLCMAELRDAGEVLGHVGTVADISREREARLAIDRAQHDLRRVIESSPEGIAVLRGSRWVFANRAMSEALGHARPEGLIGQDSSEIVHPDDRARAQVLTAEPQLASTDGAVHELRYRRAGGEYALMEVRPAALTEFDGAPAVLITARDITERKRLQAQLLMTERLLSVGTLAAGVAHEINNPLAAALGNLEWVSTRLARFCETEGPEEREASALRARLAQLRRPLNEAREAAERVRAIVRDLKLFSRAEDELEGPSDLTPVLDSAARMARHEVRQRARLVRDYGDLPAVHGNDARLGQVFLNLIINAAQAIPEGSSVAHEIHVSAHVLPHHVMVEVRDTGAGIPASVLGRIFDPFFTTKPPGVGTGLGLSICHRIVTSLGGQIEVESRVGEGSTFRVTLRRAAEGTEHVEREVRTEAPQGSVEPVRGRGRVLVIDDDPAMANIVGLVLSEDHEVEVLTSARQALNRLRQGENYDAIVCDIMMPEMGGIDFHAELMLSHPERAAEIVFMTGGAFTVRAREFLDRVPNPRLEKPFDSETLRAVVSQQVARATSVH